MIGGVLSTLFVGFLLERGNSYASVVAESYAQGGDEEFWKSLSPEDQEKAREMLDKLRESKEKKNGVGGDNGVGVGEKDLSWTSSAVGGDDVMTGATGEEKKRDEKDKGKKEAAVSMFSDYDD